MVVVAAAAAAAAAVVLMEPMEIFLWDVVVVQGKCISSSPLMVLIMKAGIMILIDFVSVGFFFV